MQKIDWTKEYRRLSGEVFHITLRYVRNRAEAEDLVQEVFLTAMEKADSFQGRGAWDGWIYRLTVNIALQHLRKQSKIHMHTLEEGKEIADREEVVAQETESRSGKEISSFQKRLTIAKADFSEEQMLDAIHCLTGPHRMVFNMYVIDGFSHKDIAQSLGIPESTSKSYLLRARKKIQDELYILALEMKKKQNSRPSLWLLWLLLIGSSHQIKAQYRRSIQDLPLSPSAPSSDFSQTLSHHAPTILQSSWSSLQLIAVGAVSGAIVGGLAVEGAHYLLSSPEPQEISAPEPIHIDTVYLYPSPFENPPEDASQRAVSEKILDLESTEITKSNQTNYSSENSPTAESGPDASKVSSTATKTSTSAKGSPAAKANMTGKNRAATHVSATSNQKTKTANSKTSVVIIEDSPTVTDEPTPNTPNNTTIQKIDKPTQNTTKSKDSHPLVKPAPVIHRKVVFDTVFIER